MVFDYNDHQYTNNCNGCKFIYIEDDIVYCVHDDANTNLTFYGYKVNSFDHLLIDIGCGYTDGINSFDEFAMRYPKFVKSYEIAVLNNLIPDILNCGYLNNGIILF